MPKGKPKSGKRKVKPSFKPGPKPVFFDEAHVRRRLTVARYNKKRKVTEEELERRLNAYFERVRTDGKR